MSEQQNTDFTQAAWESLYDAVDVTAFLEQDAQRIYDTLQHRLKFISFGEYLKRYIYRKAELCELFDEVPLTVYQQIIKASFADRFTPASFEATTAKLSALSKNWLTQQTVKRTVVFLLGFGLQMSTEDVNVFLTKALREHEINPKDPFEVICYYCYERRWNFLKFRQLWEQYITLSPNHVHAIGLNDRHTTDLRSSMLSIHDDVSLMDYLACLKATPSDSRIHVTSKKWFEQLYNEGRELIASVYNRAEDAQHDRKVDQYRAKLLNSERLYDYEKLERIEQYRQTKRRFTHEDITESDFEHILCAAIPTDRHGNLTPSKASKLNEQFAGKRFSRQRIHDILSDNVGVTRFDLITLNFFIYSQKLTDYPEPLQRYDRFLDSINAILNDCSMGGLYVQNPYECFVLMCLLALDPLGTYADVWELSYNT